MRKNTIKYVCKMGLVLGLWHSQNLWADQSTLPTVGDIANKFIVGTDFVTHMVLFSSVVLGMILIVTALSQYKAHRYNPKVVPLGRPVLFLFLGLSLCAIPFLGDIFGPTGSTVDLKKQTKKIENTTCDIDAPLEFGNEFNH